MAKIDAMPAAIDRSTNRWSGDRIAMLVHNTVERDARVIKEVKSLQSAGFDVTVFGLVGKGENARTVEVEGIRGAVHLGKPQLQHRRRWQYKPIRWIAKRLRSLSPSRSTLSPAEKEIATKRWLIRSHSLGLEAVVEQHGPFGILHCHDIIALEAGRGLARRYGAKLIWDAHELYEHLARDEPSRAQANGDVIREACGHVQGMITINQNIADYYKREFPKLPPAHIVMNATPKSAPVTDDGRLKAAAQLPSTCQILLYQGAFSPHRGLPQLVSAMTFVKPPWTLVMMGWGKIEDELRTLAEPINRSAMDRGEPAKIVFVPPAPQAELPAWTAGASLGVIPYEDICLNHKYCTPNKLWEYPDAGVPILASDLIEIRKLLTEWRTGFLMPADCDAQAIAATINAIGKTELDARRADCLAFRKAHNWSTFEPAMLDIYRRLTNSEAAA